MMSWCGGMTRMTEPNNATLNTFASQYHTDAYLLFRALCKLSAKPLPGEDGAKQSTSMMTSIMGPAVDPMALQSKVLSLQLLLGLVGQCRGSLLYQREIHLCSTKLSVCLAAKELHFYSYASGISIPKDFPHFGT